MAMITVRMAEPSQSAEEASASDSKAEEDSDTAPERETAEEAWAKVRTACKLPGTLLLTMACMHCPGA